MSFCENEAVLGNVDAKKVVRCAETGAEDAKQILAECGRNFGRTLAILVDILNPEVIVGGSMFCGLTAFCILIRWKRCGKKRLPVPWTRAGSYRRNCRKKSGIMRRSSRLL